MENIHIEDNFKWSPGDIRCLINLFVENSTQFDRQPKKKVWNEIAEKLSITRNKKVTGEQCDGKFKGLKRMYKTVKDHNNTSGNSYKKWEYFDAMDEVLNKRPEINPPATCSSDAPNVTINYSVDSSRASSSGDFDFDDLIIDESSTSSPPPSTFSRKRKRVEEERNKRHNEKMERQDRFLNLFEKLIEKL